MAILQSTGIRGFLVSVKKTGNKVVNSIGKTIDEYTENFLSGFAGHGWKLWEYISGKYKLEIDAIYGVKRTLIGSDGLYSYWGPHDYIYAKRNTSGQLDIKMRGNIEIMKRDGTVLISG